MLGDEGLQHPHLGLVCQGLGGQGHIGLRRVVAHLDRVARAQTLLSLGLWIAVIICGRWIAYV